MQTSIVRGRNIMVEYDSNRTGSLLIKNDRYITIDSFDSVLLMAFARMSNEAVIRSVTKVGMSLYWVIRTALKKSAVGGLHCSAS